VNEQIAEALARIVKDSIGPVITEKWETVAETLVNVVKSNEQFNTDANQLFKKLDELERKFDEEVIARRSLRDLEKSTLTKLNKLIDQWL